MQLTASQVIYTIFYSAISVLAIGGNGVVIYLIANYRQMRSVTNYFIFNLALGDLLMVVLCIPFTFTATFLLYNWPFGTWMCRLVSYSQAVSVFISAYTLVAISIDRYIAIIYPLRPRMTKTNSYQVILLIWIVSLLTPAPTAILSKTIYYYKDKNATTSATGQASNSSDIRVSEVLENDTIPMSCQCLEDWKWPGNDYKPVYGLMLMILQYVLPFTILVFTYTRIALVVWGKQPPGEAYGQRDAKMAASKRKVKWKFINFVCLVLLRKVY